MAPKGAHRTFQKLHIAPPPPQPLRKEEGGRALTAPPKATCADGGGRGSGPGSQQVRALGLSHAPARPAPLSPPSARYRVAFRHRLRQQRPLSTPPRGEKRPSGSHSSFGLLLPMSSLRSVIRELDSARLC